MDADSRAVVCYYNCLNNCGLEYTSVAAAANYILCGGIFLRGDIIIITVASAAIICSPPPRGNFRPDDDR